MGERKQGRAGAECRRRLGRGIQEKSMINLKDVSYVRLGSPDLESAETFATSCLGLQVAERGKKALYLRSADRSHTLCYTEVDPKDQAVGFEVEDEDCLQQAPATLQPLAHPAPARSPHPT